MKIKPGVQIRNMQPQVVLALNVGDGILCGSLVLTCGSDGVHKRGSLHYVGLAADVGIPHREQFVADWKAALGAEYDVVLEADHVHVEYQPKVRAS